MLEKYQVFHNDSALGFRAIWTFTKNFEFHFSNKILYLGRDNYSPFLCVDIVALPKVT